MTDDIFMATVTPMTQNAWDVSRAIRLYPVHLALNSKCHHLHKSAGDLTPHQVIHSVRISCQRSPSLWMKNWLTIQNVLQQNHPWHLTSLYHWSECSSWGGSALLKSMEKQPLIFFFTEHIVAWRLEKWGWEIQSCCCELGPVTFWWQACLSQSWETWIRNLSKSDFIRDKTLIYCSASFQVSH